MFKTKALDINEPINLSHIIYLIEKGISFPSDFQTKDLIHRITTRDVMVEYNVRTMILTSMVITKQSEENEMERQIIFLSARREQLQNGAAIRLLRNLSSICIFNAYKSLIINTKSAKPDVQLIKTLEITGFLPERLNKALYIKEL